MKEKKIKAIIIVEIMGRPPEYAQDALKNHVGQIRNKKGVSVISESVSEPKKIENSDLYTCFAEIEFEAETLFNLIEIIFDYMPSSVEILEPDELVFGINDATNFLNDLTGRLHKYDEIAKVAQIQNQQLAARLSELEGKLSKDIQQIEEIKTNTKKTKKTKKK